jgi:hypothetical protein
MNFVKILEKINKNREFIINALTEHHKHIVVSP